ncbi:hypothetical protein [Chondromyces crocatus]|nr:hypothetical protein [Chondromyces crocatus]
MRVAETMAWWTLENPLVFQPGDVVRRRSRLTAKEGDASDHPERVVREIVEARAKLLEQSGWPGRLPARLLPGRLMLLVPSFNLRDGAAWLASFEFYGEFDLPPCDLWVDLLPQVRIRIGDGDESAFLSWIPDEFIHLAQEGIDVNGDGSIDWVEALSPQIHEELRGYTQSRDIDSVQPNLFSTGWAARVSRRLPDDRR